MSAGKPGRPEPPPRLTPRDCTVARADGHLTVRVTVTNEDPRPLFAVDHVRRVQMDAATGRLVLWFSDRGKVPDPLVRQERSAPRALPLEPGETRTLVARLREDLTRLVPHADGTFHLEAVDLSAATQVEVRIAVARAPFYYNPARGGLLEQLAAWGADVAVRARPADPPGQTPGKGPGKGPGTPPPPR